MVEELKKYKEANNVEHMFDLEEPGPIHVRVVMSRYAAI